MIRLTINRKLFLAIFGLAAALVVLLALVTRWSLGAGFERYTSSVEFARVQGLIGNLESAYAEHGNWDFVRADPEAAWQAADAPQDAVSRLSLLDAEGRWLAGNRNGGHGNATRSLTYQGRTVGYVTLQPSPPSLRRLDEAFLASETENLVVAGVAALALSFFAAWLLARHLLMPIHDLRRGARRIIDGRLDARIPVRSDDELGELARNFNAMAEQLARMEESRRTWIADASHELSTPLAVLRGEIEALQDGVRVPDQPTFERLHKQVMRLSSLVDDLRSTLHQAPGTGGMADRPFAPLAVLSETIAAFQKRFADAGLTIEVAGAIDQPCHARGDARRISQVFSNLLENSRRYTKAGGRLRIGIAIHNQRLVLKFDDTTPAPPESALPHLFERFFRVESSRSRTVGGSGLGLAICKTLVEAHAGTISAELSELGGLCVRIELPLERL